VVYAGLSDTRDCSMCACDAPTDCSLNIVRLGDASCQNPATPAVPLGQCANINDQNPNVNGFEWNAVGDCNPSGGQPTGSATPTSPTTFCCEG
jgi:hypothetical protein